MENRIVKISDHSSQASDIDLFVTLLKSVGFTQMESDDNILEYINKDRDMGQEIRNLKFVIQMMHNWIIIMLNANYLQKQASNCDCSSDNNINECKEIELKTIENEDDIKDSDIDLLVSQLHQETLAILRAVIDKQTAENHLRSLKHELSIVVNLEKNHTSAVKNYSFLVYTVATFILINVRRETVKNRNMKNDKNYYVNRDYIIYNSNPIRVSQIYSKQLIELGQKMLFMEKKKKEEVSMHEWQCFYCSIMNESHRDSCQSCEQGLNPLYFVKRNKSNNFNVKDKAFGTFVVRSTESVKFEHM